MDLSISGSVGKGGDNSITDVLVVQILLNRFVLSGTLSGYLIQLPLPYVSEGMVMAIEAFQHDVMGFSSPDGRIDPGGKTIKRLNGPVPSGEDPVPKPSKGTPPPSPPNPAGTESFGFPFPKLPKKHWTGGSRYFGAKRGKQKTRRHAGCDLIFPEGTPIHAIANGDRVRGPYEFTGPDSDPPYPLSHAVEIQHGPILIRYGEIAPGSYKAGDDVKQGKVIAKVGALDMLHFEVYTNGEGREPLSNKVMPFKRRSDLTDPDPYLRLWQRNLPMP